MSSEEDNLKTTNRSVDKSLSKSTDSERFANNLNFVNKSKIIYQRKNTQESKVTNHNMDSFKGIPSFIEKVNQNIQNIDILLNSREINSNHSNDSNVVTPSPSYLNLQKRNSVNKSQMVQECFDIKNIVKQSVEGIKDILRSHSSSKITKDKDNKADVQVSVKNLKIIEEEDVIVDIEKMKNSKKSFIANNHPNSVINSKRLKIANSAKSTASNDTSPTINLSKKISAKNSSITASNAAKKSNIKESFIAPSNVPKIENFENIKENINKVVKNINVVKEKFNKLNNYVNPVSPSTPASKVSSNASLIHQNSNNIPNAPITNRKKSINMRYEFDNKEKEQEVETENEVSNRKVENKSKSPVTGLRNYQLKPKAKKQNENSIINHTNSNNYLSNNKDAGISNQRASKKHLHTDNTNSNNLLLARYAKDNKNYESNYVNSVSNTLNSNRYNNMTKEETNNTVNTLANSRTALPNAEFNLNNFLQMLFLFNEFTYQNHTENEEKIISEDFSKLLCSLIDNEDTNNKDKSTENLVTVDDRNIENENIESNPTPIVPVPMKNIRINLKNDKIIPTKNLLNIDIKYVLLIQNKWREYKFFKISNLKFLDKDKINSEFKKSILNSFSNNDTCKKIFTIFNHSMQMFSGVLKNNKSKFYI